MSLGGKPKLNFILQLGYFEVRRLFFNFELREVSVDVEFIRQKYFPDEIFEVGNLPKIAVNALLPQVKQYLWGGRSGRMAALSAGRRTSNRKDDKELCSATRQVGR